ncbi:MAG: hypothetical protein QM703_26900 [Gemmatales bacterium]
MNNFSIEELEFMGMIETVAEKEYWASFNCEHDLVLRKKILAEYQAAGSPKSKRKWITDRLRSVFVCLQEKPKWIENKDYPWPFHEDQPMVFIQQIKVPKNSVSETQLVPETMLYVFGAKVPVEGGNYRMKYEVVECYLSDKFDWNDEYVYRQGK